MFWCWRLRGAFVTGSIYKFEYCSVIGCWNIQVDCFTPAIPSLMDISTYRDVIAIMGLPQIYHVAVLLWWDINFSEEIRASRREPETMCEPESLPSTLLPSQTTDIMSATKLMSSDITSSPSLSQVGSLGVIDRHILKSNLHQNCFLLEIHIIRTSWTSMSVCELWLFYHDDFSK